MATTRLMPLHIGKGQTAGDAIKRALGYIKDPMKTENGILVTSYGCTPQTAEAEFMLMRREYLTITGRRRGKQVFFENAHEAIVDRQAWEKAHEAFEKPKRAEAENADSNFKDFVFCAGCGAPMSNLHHAQHLKTRSSAH